MSDTCPAYADSPRAPGEHPVEYFWRLLEQLCREHYPAGVAPVGEHHVGTAAFSAGTGLFRSGEEMPQFPVGEILVVAHNLNAEKTYLDWIARGVDPGATMRYWRNTFRLLERAEIDKTKVFWTNFFVGLKEGDRATGVFPGARDPAFTRWCETFLDTQIRTMQPRLVLTFGREATERMGFTMSATKRTRAGITFVALGLRHPSAAISHDRLAADAAAMRAAFAVCPEVV